MKALIKLILYLAGLLVVLCIATGIWVAHLDPNEHKNWISAKVQEKTGRVLKLDGDINISFYPWLGVEANNISLGNAAGFSDEYMLHSEYVKLRIKLLPLLQEKYEVDTVSLHGAIIHLEKDRNGVTNWQDLVSEEEQEKPAMQLPLAAIVLGGVDIKNAQISWNDQTTETKYNVRSININTGELTYGAPIDLSVTFDITANKPDIAADVVLNGIISYDVDNERYSVKPLQLSSTLTGKNIPGGKTTMSLSSAIDMDLAADTATLSNLVFDALETHVAGELVAGKLKSPAPSLQTRLAIKGDDLALLFKVAEIEPLASQLAKLKNRGFKLNTTLDIDLERGDVDMSQFAARLLDASINGEIKARNIYSKSPGLKGAINASGPDLPTLLQVAGQFAGKKSTLKQYGRQLADVSDKAFSVRMDFDADLKSGDIDIPTLAVDTLGINIDGNLKARDMQTDTGSVNGKLSVKTKSLKPILKAVKQDDLAQVLNSINLDAGIQGDRNNIHLQPLSLNTVLAGKDIPNSPVKVILDADTNVSLKKEQLDLNSFMLKGLGLDVNGQLSVRRFMTAPELNGRLTVAQFNLRNLMKQLNQTLPVTADKKALGNVALDTQFDGSAKNVNISQLSLQLDDTKLDGSISVSDYANPAIRFGININQINLDRYLPPKAQPKGGKAITDKKPAAAETTSGTAVQLPVELLRSLNLKGDLAVDKLIISNAHLSNVKFSIDAKDGKIKLKPVGAHLYEGVYNGDIQLDAGVKLPKLTVNSSLTGIKIAPLLKDVMGQADLVGTGDISVAVVAFGSDTEAFKQTLNGLAEIRMGKGVLRGVNVKKILRQVEIMIESKQFGKIDKSGNTQFNSLTATLPINAGVVSNEDLLLTAPGFNVTGAGMLARISDMSWKYDLKVDVVADRVKRGEETYKLGGYHIPIKCRGLIDAGNCNPDISELAGIAVKKIVIDELFKKADKQPAAPTQQQSQPVDPGKQLIDDALKSIFNN